MSVERTATNIYLSRQERDLLDQLAAAHEMTMSAYIRMLIRREAAELGERAIPNAKPKQRQPEYV